jgi:hypothetical protein
LIDFVFVGSMFGAVSQFDRRHLPGMSAGLRPLEIVESLKSAPETLLDLLARVANLLDRLLHC